jgi:predicted metal-dependent phosphoesterase TrpH
MGFADLHMHTIYSFDGTAPVRAVLERAKQVGLDVIAITDHDEIRGALKALTLATMYGLEVIPGMEVTTSEGDLLALKVTEKIQRGLPLVDTILQVRERGGFCIAPHPMASGLGMNSLGWPVISMALKKSGVADTLLGIETYNATLLDRLGNHYAEIMAGRVHLAGVGSSDAHVLDAIGLGATEFSGSSAAELISALRNGTTSVCIGEQWSSMKILGSWLAKYLFGAFARLSLAAQ